MIDGEIPKQDSMDSTAFDQLNSLARFETLLSNLSAQFINLPLDQVDEAIDRAMGEVRGFFGIERWALMEVISNQRSVQPSHSSYGHDIPEVPKTTNLALLFPWCYQRLVENIQLCIYSNLDDLPAEADLDKQNFQAMGIQSVFLLPLCITGKVKYIMSANSTREARHWPGK
jgi:hypothetical protein